jgi:hypothetical protein
MPKVRPAKGVAGAAFEYPKDKEKNSKIKMAIVANINLVLVLKIIAYLNAIFSILFSSKKLKKSDKSGILEGFARAMNGFFIALSHIFFFHFRYQKCEIISAIIIQFFVLSDKEKLTELSTVSGNQI